MLMFVIAAAALAAPPVGQSSEAIRLDGAGRPMIGVRIDGRGPFDMLVDTAAQTSVMTTALVGELGLRQLEEEVTVRGAAGVSIAHVYAAPRITTALFDLRDAELLALPRIATSAARGVLGMDIFAGRKVVFDLAARRLSVEASGPSAAGHVAVRGSNTANRITIPVVVDGITVDAVVDTGAQGSVANAALLHALGWRDDDPRLKANGTASGVGAAAASVRLGRVGAITIGPARFRDVPLTFTGAMPAGSAGGVEPAEKPRMILGMDLLAPMSRFAVDLSRAELQIYVPPPKG